ncbi:LINE-1 retrotransposable element ORF2 protein [Eumeta japonica]|uniref:LINE-1 retrotransposable element ORF2 protein n=1 Tax=Eumeta variegata TaxID=151549 RepID=A0A4C1X538_EUMVA|nr:LINE-1 retrotransposable element ORF2 protein [Eumeta japonica]
MTDVIICLLIFDIYIFFALEQRNQLINSKEAKDRRRRLVEISKDIKESIRTDNKKRRMEIIEKHANRTGGVKKAKKELKNSKDWIPKIKSDSGEWNHNRMNILGIATSYYKKIYEHNTTQDKDDLTGTSNIPNILYTEVIKAIDSQKSDKAPGPNAITNEILKESKEVITPVLTDIFNEILNTIPQQWTEANIILLYKKADKYETGNYRPISLMSNIYKLFAKIILNRIEKRLDEHQLIEQAGFRKDYSVLDHIHVVRQVMENQSTARIQLEKKGEPFIVGKGVRQGDPLSPKLFSAVLESVFRGLNWENFGINKNGILLSHLRFADDIVLFAKSPEDITKMINELTMESEKVGLKLNPQKTRVMTNGERININLGNKQIDYTDEYIYLGQLITDDDPMRKEIERRITNGWRRVDNYHHRWTLRIPEESQVRLIASSIGEGYLMEWGLTKGKKELLRGCEVMTRRILLNRRTLKVPTTRLWRTTFSLLPVNMSLHVYLLTVLIVNTDAVIFFKYFDTKIAVVI